MVRVGYVPYDHTFMRPGDRRRFVRYATARSIPFEIADPAEKYDVVILSELADISVWRDYPHGKVVFDLIDAYLSIPRTNIRQALRGPYFYATGRHRRCGDYLSQLRAMCARADAVVCSTGEQAELIGKYCNNVRIILDIHDMVTTAIKKDYGRDGPIRLVWEGLPSNLPQLRNLPDGIASKLRTITDPDWKEETIAQEVIKHDVAVIPINLDDPFVASKPENKLLFFWRCGMPVIVSATKAHKRAMANAGMPPQLCCTYPHDWKLALDLMGDESRRRWCGLLGYKYATAVDNSLERWDQLFKSIGLCIGDLRDLDRTTWPTYRRRNGPLVA